MEKQLFPTTAPPLVASIIYFPSIFVNAFLKRKITKIYHITTSTAMKCYFDPAVNQGQLVNHTNYPYFQKSSKNTGTIRRPLSSVI